MTGVTLLLNAAEQILQFGLARDGGLVCGQEWRAAAQGAELLAPALADALRRLRLKPADIDRIACVTGPGSFTGLRLILGTASAMRHTLGIPLAGVNYLELLAESACALPGQTMRVLTRARRDLAYCQDFRRCDDGSVVPLGPPGVRERHTLLEGLPDSPRHPVLCLGSALGLLPGPMSETAGLPDPADLPSMAGLPDLIGRAEAQPHWEAFLRLAARADYGDEELVPLYLRASEAEDNLELLAGRRGDDPAASRAALQRLLERPPGSRE
jgi:tRNA threonylcarbamoyl adenosine modification protein YeaZ